MLGGLSAMLDLRYPGIGIEAVSLTLARSLCFWCCIGRA